MNLIVLELNFRNKEKKKERVTESGVMTSWGGTKRSFSPFLILFKATRPLSPTSTLSMDIFWEGRPDWDSHFWREDEFSIESFSHPQGIVSINDEVAESVKWAWFLRERPRCVVLCIVWLKAGIRVVVLVNIIIPKASTMVVMLLSKTPYTLSTEITDTTHTTIAKLILVCCSSVTLRSCENTTWSQS